MRNIRKALLVIYVFILLTFGFWVNYTSFTLIIDVAGIMLFLFSLIRNKGRIPIQGEIKFLYQEFFVFLIGLFIVLVSSILNGFPLTMCILGSRDYYEFMLLGLLVTPMIMNVDEHDSFLTYITTLSVIMCAFGILQFALYNYLPDSLLHVRSDQIDYVYGLGTLIYRINGLYENAIVFDGIIIISSALAFGALLVKGKSFLRIIGFGITIVANILTFSRASIVGSVLVYVIEYFLLSERGRASKYIRIITCGLLAFFVFITFGSETAVFQRIFNASITASSDSVHIETISEAQSAVIEHWLLGIGIGTQGYDSTGSTVGIVRDGCWWQFLLELGIPLTIVYAGIIASLMIIAIKRIKIVDFNSGKIACGVYISMMVYFLVAGFVNSAYNAKEVFGLCWVLTGMMLWLPTQFDRREPQ